LAGEINDQGIQYIGQNMMNPTRASLILNSGLVLVIVAVNRIRLHEVPGKSTYWKAALLIGFDLFRDMSAGRCCLYFCRTDDAL